MQITDIVVTLMDVTPPVTRRLEVPADIPLDRLHATLQAAFGWHNAHLFMFCVGEPYQMGETRWVLPNFVDSAEDLPADGTTLAQALSQAGGSQLTYLYDFGDDWEHLIEARDTREAAPGTLYPRLTEITGTCPPEDVGGLPGYEMFLEAMANPKHPEHRDLRDWYGGSFDPDRPDAAALRRHVDDLARSWAG